MPYCTMSPKRGGAWTKVVIFVTLYTLLLQSLVEWVLVLYLYGNKHVDTKMAPSLIFALVASFLTVPLVILHSFLGWQYNNVLGYASQKAKLHTVCAWILRITTIVWLGASVAGLVVVSQQAYCYPDSASGSYWRVGVSCALHRAVVIVSVLSFVTVCLYFCSRELCERPYDVSLLGVYSRQRSSRDGSILSASTLKSEKSLKHDILCVCRHPDVTYGRAPYVTQSNSEESKSLASIQQPTPIRPTSHLRFSPDPDAEAEYLSGRTVASGTHSDPFQSSVSRTPSTMTAQTGLQVHTEALPELPGATLQPNSNHKRNQSSSSSVRRFLPKSSPVSMPLSSDPQIRALAEASANVDLEKQEPPKDQPETSASLTSPAPSAPEGLPTQAHPAPPAGSPPPPPKRTQSATTLPNIARTPSTPRSTNMDFADAPEVVTPPAPLNIHKPNTMQPPFSPLASHPNPTHTLNNPQTQNPTPSSWATLLNPNQPRPLRMTSQTMRLPRRQSLGQYQGQYNPYVPRYTQSQRFPGSSNRNRYGRQLRRNDTEVFYQHPSSRRPRSSTFGNMSAFTVPGHLDCIRETGASIDELPPGDGRLPGGGRGC